MASAAKEIGVVIEEPLAPIEEIPVQVRFLYTLGGVFVLAYVFSIRPLILGFTAFVVSSLMGFGPFVAATLIALYVVVYVWGLLERTRRSTSAWLRFEGKSFAVRTEHDWGTMVPKAIEWKSPESFVLKGSGMKVQVSLPTGDGAARVVQRIRASFSEAKEAL